VLEVSQASQLCLAASFWVAAWSFAARAAARAGRGMRVVLGLAVGLVNLAAWVSTALLVGRGKRRVFIMAMFGGGVNWVDSERGIPAPWLIQLVGMVVKKSFDE
jgi:hypothetical protein